MSAPREEPRRPSTDEWLRRLAGARLRADQLAQLLMSALEALFRRAAVPLGDVTVASVFGRVLYDVSRDVQGVLPVEVEGTSLRSKSLPADTDRDALERFNVEWARGLRNDINKKYTFIHPEDATIAGCSHILWTGTVLDKKSTARNAVFYGEKAIDRRIVPIEIGDPAGRRELGRPHDIQLQDVRIAHPGIEPLDVELMPLVGGVGSGAQRHLDRRMGPRKAVKLPADDVGLAPDRTAGEGQRRLAGSGTAREGHGRTRGQPDHRRSVYLRHRCRPTPS